VGDWIEWKVSIGALIQLVVFLAGGVIAVHRLFVRMDRMEERMKTAPNKEDFVEVVVKVNAIWEWFRGVFERREQRPRDAENRRKE
jgi:hypothetical protein